MHFQSNSETSPVIKLMYGFVMQLATCSTNDYGCNVIHQRGVAVKTIVLCPAGGHM